MTKTEQVQHERLQASLAKCRMHLKRLQYASTQLTGLFPLSLNAYSGLSEATVGHIDQLIFRFTKLQDELGNHTFRFLLGFLQEDIAGKPFRDILNTLERLQVIDSADTWLTLREIRNDLTHEYPMLVDETVDKLNHLMLKLPVLEEILFAVERTFMKYQPDPSGACPETSGTCPETSGKKV